jgi:RES domain-containing protein
LTPLPGPLAARAGGKAHALPTAGGLLFWRLDKDRHLGSWASGEGAFQVGGRWNARGTRVVYGALDPATALLEVAVHAGFSALDAVAHSLVCARWTDLSRVKVLPPEAFPDTSWLRPGVPGAAQQAFAAEKMKLHPVLVLPSVVSPHSWNVVIDVAAAVGQLDTVLVERFSLDGRLLDALRSAR